MGAFAEWRNRRRERRAARRTRYAEQRAAKAAALRGRGDEAAKARIEGRVEGPFGDHGAGAPPMGG